MEAKQIKDYLPYYLGCKVLWGTKEVNGVAVLKQTDGINCDVIYNGITYRTNIQNVQPFLYPLSSMTKADRTKYGAIQEDGLWGVEYIGSEGETSYAFVSFEDMALTINMLRKDGFDCDGLIEAGLAIELQD